MPHRHDSIHDQTRDSNDTVHCARGVAKIWLIAPLLNEPPVTSAVQSQTRDSDCWSVERFVERYSEATNVFMQCLVFDSGQAYCWLQMEHPQVFRT
jgi:hypothetical protein